VTSLQQRILLPAGIAAMLVGAIFLGDALRPVLRETPLGGVRYGVSLALNLLDLVLLSAVILLFGGREARDLPRLAGISAPILPALAFALLIFGPATAAAALLAPMAETIDPHTVAMQAVIFPIIEEVGFRGLAIGALMRIAGWPFLLAALLPAAVFGAVHMYQGESLEEIAGVVAITGLGGMLLGWIFVRWGFNLWPAIVAHVGLNALWIFFDLGENAIGGWVGNALRVWVIVAAILYTLYIYPGRRSAKQ